LIIDGVGRTTFKGDLEAAAVRGHIVIFGAASGHADPISPNSFMPNALTVSGGSLQNYLRTPEELMQRANDVIAGIRAGWLKLNIGRVLPLAQAAQAHELLETTGAIESTSIALPKPRNASLGWFCRPARSS
jgi:NADPH:quinone reductase